MESNAVKRLYRIEGIMGIFTVSYFLMFILMFIQLWYKAETLGNHVLAICGCIAIVGGGVILGWAILLMVYKKDYSRYRKLRKNEETLRHLEIELRRLEKRVKVLTNDRDDLKREIQALRDDDSY